MSPAAYWASMVFAGAIVTVCLIVLDTSLIWASASAGAFLLAAAAVYRPRRGWPVDTGEDDEREPTC